MVSEAIIKEVLEELAGMPNKEFYKKLMRSNRKGKCCHPRTCMGNAREWEVVMSAKSSKETRVIKSSPADLVYLRVYFQMLSGLGMLNLYMKNKRRSDI